MNDTEFRQQLAKLKTQLAINDAKLMANPKPYLEDMGRRCSEVLKVLEEVEYALSSDYIFDVWNNNVNKQMIERPGDIQGEAYIRCTKALEVLDTYKKS